MGTVRSGPFVPSTAGWSVTRSVVPGFGGAEGRDRTGDLTITNRLLYQLSYLGSKQAQSNIARKKLSNHAFGTASGKPTLCETRNRRGQVQARQFQRESGYISQPMATAATKNDSKAQSA